MIRIGTTKKNTHNTHNDKNKKQNNTNNMNMFKNKTHKNTQAIIIIIITGRKEART